MYSICYKTYKDGDPVTISYDAGQFSQWVVNFRGAGHYFGSPAEATDYAVSRKFIPVGMIDGVIAILNEQENLR